MAEGESVVADEFADGDSAANIGYVCGDSCAMRHVAYMDYLLGSWIGARCVASLMELAEPQIAGERRSARHMKNLETS